MFVGRQQELSLLEAHYQASGFVFDVLYGRRRVGKTCLIQEYIKDKPAVYFMAIEANAAANLAGMSAALHRYIQQPGLSAYQTFEALFDALTHLSRSQRLVFVIDEYPYLAAAVPEIPSLLQRYCDHAWPGSQLHLILCGSSMSFMEHQVLGAKSPLYGRRTSQILLKPFTFFETRSMLPAFSMQDCAILHDATGGIPEYQRFVRQDQSVGSNLTDLFLRPGGRMLEEPANLLKQELREPRVYNTILDAMASGASKSSEIATKSGMESAALNRYLSSLEELSIIKREKPLGGKQSRRTIYRIMDGSFRFWYRFVQPNLSAVASGLGEQVYERLVQPRLSDHMGQGFEHIFFDYFDRLQQQGALPDLAGSRGRWWGNNPALRQEEEIDLIAPGQNITFFGEAKWRNEPMKADVIQELERKSLLIPASKRYYLLLSKSGYAQSARQYADGRTDIQLIPFV
jgi:AAA+ ATPase superfamily predicted ATPase